MISAELETTRANLAPGSSRLELGAFAEGGFAGDPGRAGGYLEARSRPTDWLTAIARGERADRP